MILGTSVRVGCDHEHCPEVGSVPVPSEWEHQETGARDVQKLLHANGWFLTMSGVFCYRHKPKDWDDPAHESRPLEKRGQKV